MHSYDTVSEALNDLRTRGYTKDFNLRKNSFYCTETEQEYHMPQLQVMETHRFEGYSDPADQAVVYALQAKDGVKGVFVNGYGTYADIDSDAFLQLCGEKKVDFTANK